MAVRWIGVFFFFVGLIPPQAYLGSNFNLASNGFHGCFEKDVGNKKSDIGIGRFRGDGIGNSLGKVDRLLLGLRIEFPISTNEWLSCIQGRAGSSKGWSSSCEGRSGRGHQSGNKRAGSKFHFGLDWLFGIFCMMCLWRTGKSLLLEQERPRWNIWNVSWSGVVDRQPPINTSGRAPNVGWCDDPFCLDTSCFLSARS